MQTTASLTSEVFSPKETHLDERWAHATVLYIRQYLAASHLSPVCTRGWVNHAEQVKQVSYTIQDLESKYIQILQIKVACTGTSIFIPILLFNRL